jgi:hypothetical protein
VQYKPSVLRVVALCMSGFLVLQGTNSLPNVLCVMRGRYKMLYT